jgi:O-antigen/teichoic acid export membrane protein
MANAGLASMSEEAYSIFNLWAQKLVIIPVTLATSFGLTLIPTITKAYVSRDRKSLRKYLNQTFQVVMFLTVPAVVGMAVLAEPVYAAFYGHDALGEQVLRWYAPAAILFALFSVTAAVLQGINQQRFTMISLSLGLLAKLLLNTFLITQFATIGAILATTFGYFVSVALNLWIIKKYTNYRYQFVIRRTVLIGILTAIMSVGAVAVFYVCRWLFDYEGGRIESIVIVGLSALVGAGLYFWMSERIGLLAALFGNRFAFLQKKKKAVS